MDRDIIYIDTDDDITAIIGKIKSAKEQEVVLVPPKRTGILQSAVNLRLLARIAKSGKKDLSIITNNHALSSLASSAKIPVAKNLQAKPELTPIDTVDIDEGDDIIEGAKLPVGELVKTVDYSNSGKAEDHLSSIDIDNEGPQYVPPTLEKNTDTPKKKDKNKVNIPDFSKFRKKLFLIGGSIVAFVVFMVWAIWFAPSAKVIINAKTEPAPVSATLRLSETTDVNKNEIQSITKTTQKDLTVDFTATGSKMVGKSAKGTVVFKNCETMSSQTLPAGTLVIANGLSYTTDNSVTVPGGTGSFFGCSSPGTSPSVAITAADIGSDYNVASGTTFSVSNHANTSDVYLRAVSTSAISGGESHMGTVVTAEDIQKASEALVDQSTDEVKQQLTDEFSNGEKIINDSFTVDRSVAVSTPAVDTEAVGGKATLKSKTTFSLTAIAKSELEAYLRNSINKQLQEGKQRMYSDGYDKVTFSGFNKTDKTSTVNISTVGQIGPNIDETSIKDQVKGMRYGDAQELLQSIEGVSSADVKFSYFWVTSIPNDINKIDVEFVINNA